MKKYFSFILALFLAVPGHAVDFEYTERGRVRATWANAQAWAHFLVMSDLLQSLSKVLNTLDSDTLGRQETVHIEQKMVELAANYDRIANDKEFKEEDLKRIVNLNLSEYRKLINTQFDLSWKPAVKTYNSKFVANVIKTSMKDFEIKCKNGRSEQGIDVEVPVVDIPSLGMGITFSPSLDTGVSASAHFSSGSENSDWQRHKGPLRMMSTMVIAVAAPPAAVLFEIIFTMVDSFISRHETNKIEAKYAAALSKYHASRARGGDVSRLYREYCETASEGLNYITKILEAGPGVQEQIAFSKTPEFDAELKDWIKTEQVVGDAICRVGLQDSAKHKKCLSWTVPPAKPKLVEEPVCRKYSLGGIVTDFPYKTEHRCPLVEITEETSCRITEDKKSLRNRAYGCEIPVENYECSANHIRDLQTSGRDADAEYCKEKPQREAEENRIKAEKEAKFQEKFKQCQLNASLSSSSSGPKVNCEYTSRRAVEQEYEKSKELLEKEEIERYRKMETERSAQRTELRTKILESSELVGLYTVRTIEDQDFLTQRISEVEATLEGKRLAARERLLKMIRLIESTMTTKLDADSAEYKALLIIQRDFIRLTARVIQNIMLSKNNIVEYGELADLRRAIDEFSARNPLAKSFTLKQSIEKLIGLLGGQ